MLPKIRDVVWVFDCEWVPDPAAGRLLYGLASTATDAEVLAEMWRRNGATDENPFPFLKYALCRLVSIAVVERRVKKGADPAVTLLWLPRQPEDPAQAAEPDMLRKFLEAVGRHRPQLVGFNSQGSDLRVLLQRAVVHGLPLPEFCRRPQKPWDEEPDYLARFNQNPWNVDLLETLGGGSRAATPSLHEIAVQCGIPGKFDAEGPQVAHLWLAGQWPAVIRYNCCDAISTYLLWLRMAFVGGLFDRDQYELEQELVREMLMNLAEQPDGEWAERYLDEWQRLEEATGQL
ncbi:MAG: 3'-5' exonuclease [Kiritimatiellae bacterium]|nr:3'-5' exonuclease [Kiritimatiellia bacterium]